MGPFIYSSTTLSVKTRQASNEISIMYRSMVSRCHVIVYVSFHIPREFVVAYNETEERSAIGITIYDNMKNLFSVAKLYLSML